MTNNTDKPNPFPHGFSTPQAEISIITNMAFWQSQRWTSSVDSIHPDHGKYLSGEPSWWRQAWSLFLRRANTDVVLTLGVRESMAYGLLCLLTGRPAKQIMTEVFIDESRNSPVWKIKTRLYGMIARRCIGILTNSSAEISSMSERYDLPADKFRFVPLNSTLADASYSENDDGYILSAGRTLRDYPTLIKATEKLNVPVHIVCGHTDVFPAPLPQNVTIYRELSWEAYVDQIARCTVVVLPLLPTSRATGQVVMLDAMAMGKPVVVSQLPGTVDYLRDGENGFLVEPGDVNGLKDVIEKLLASTTMRKTIGQTALSDVKKNYTFDTHANLKLNAIHQLYNAFSGGPRL